MDGLPRGFQLQDGEAIVLHQRPTRLAALGAMIFTLGLYEFWRRATHFILTDRRVVVAKGRVTKSVRAVPLDRVQDAQVTTQLWVGFVALSTAGGALGIEKIGPMRTGQAREFARLAQEQMHARGGGSSLRGTNAAKTNDPVEQLKRLGELRESGVISEADFEEKK